MSDLTLEMTHKSLWDMWPLCDANITRLHRFSLTLLYGQHQECAPSKMPLVETGSVPSANLHLFS